MMSATAFEKCKTRLSFIETLFKERFGEENVCILGSYKVNGPLASESDTFEMLIHWKEVLLKNEMNQSHKLYDVYIKVPINTSGLMRNGLSLTRTTFTKLEWIGRYIHSHVPSRSTNMRNAPWWQSPCLGSGPINNVISNLRITFDEDMWRMFAFEIGRYVRTESISGGPYYRMSNISRVHNNTEAIFPLSFYYSGDYLRRELKEEMPTNCKLYMKDFIKFLEGYIKKFPIQYHFINNTFHVKDIKDWWLELSNSFIDTLQLKYPSSKVLNILDSSSLFIKVTCENRKFFELDGGINIPNPGEHLMFSFNGKPVYLKIIDEERKSTEAEEGILYLLRPKLAQVVQDYIISKITYNLPTVLIQ